MSDVLTELVAQAVEQTARRRKPRGDAELSVLASAAPEPRDFVAALCAQGLSVIAEVKPRSTSQGSLTHDYRPIELARAYEIGGASSIPTHEVGFGGSPEHLLATRDTVDIPILHEDVIVDEYQVLEARAFDADALLPIVAALPTDRLAELLTQTRELGMEALVEVHDADEVDTALSVGAQIIGVNHRALRDFTIDRASSARLRDRIGSRQVIVGESGIRHAEDARRLAEAGVDAVLAGELLMRAKDPATVIKELAP
ncbi:indole-3-glycerol-phosphate synthase [Streptomyces sp. YC419]|uniref:indole-3-glycerol-phosphate synthase n=1 Tax=Streptomyces ureilyticus TaxID=1775131 RepID=A0ABX0DUX7_9ACTN|nr:indole-3-glycerol-phosphate synthase [Streptomyces ureilyticus]